MDASRKYTTAAISTQQRGKLIVMLYEGAIKFLKTARARMEEGDYALKGVYIGKAQDIIMELNNSLNVEAAPQIGNDLRALYNFLYRYLNEANVERSFEKIDESIGILTELAAAWEEVASSAAVADAERAAGGGYNA